MVHNGTLRKRWWMADRNVSDNSNILIYSLPHLSNVNFSPSSCQKVLQMKIPLSDNEPILYIKEVAFSQNDSLIIQSTFYFIITWHYQIILWWLVLNFSVWLTYITIYRICIYNIINKLPNLSNFQVILLSNFK